MSFRWETRFSRKVPWSPRALLEEDNGPGLHQVVSELRGFGGPQFREDSRFHTFSILFYLFLGFTWVHYSSQKLTRT